ncbi:hypothetical protein SS50377_23839 [Spironucleus salmonicida]|nr:hypothetical protein SS50377_23839 [Spironucleus salmonicida]
MEFNQPNYFEQDQLKLEQSLIYQNNKLNLTHIICNFYIKKKALERQKVRFESGGILVNTDEVIFKKIKIMLNKKSTKNNENYTQYIYQIFKTDKKFCLEWFQNRIQIINLLQQYMLKFTEKSCITIQRKNGIYF